MRDLLVNLYCLKGEGIEELRRLRMASQTTLLFFLPLGARRAAVRNASRRVGVERNTAENLSSAAPSSGTSVDRHKIAIGP
jgi:hypothetical protein